MTAQEALDKLDKTVTVDLQWKIVLTNALEKQIPKKIIKKIGECYSMTKDGTARHEITFVCPSCNAMQEGDDYCWKCGQKLKWW